MEKLKITKGAGKMEDIQSINSNPLDNKFCNAMAQGNTVCAACYSRKSLKGYRKGCGPAWGHNGRVLSEKEHKVADFPRLNASIFRVHSHGEIINRTHARNLFRFARRNPQTIFGFWTKRKDLVKGMHKPKNVVMIYSNPVIDQIVTKPPAGFHKVFNVVSKESDAEINCGGRKCIECQRCYSFDTTKVIVERVK